MCYFITNFKNKCCRHRQLTREQRLTKDAMLLFMVKDQDYFGMSSQFMGEAYYSFLDIPSTTMETNIQEMQQIHLKLSKPTNFGENNKRQHRSIWTKIVYNAQPD